MGSIVTLSGPAGAGKETAWRGALRLVPEFKLGMSATTRDERPSDTAYGPTMYRYCSLEEFKELERDGKLLETDEHFGKWYGKLVPDPNEHTLLELDVHGARNVRDQFPDITRTVLIRLPEPMRELQRARILGRDPNMDPAELEDRLDRADHEVAYAMETGPDLVIINDGIPDKIIQELADFLRSLLS